MAHSPTRSVPAAELPLQRSRPRTCVSLFPFPLFYFVFSFILFFLCLFNSYTLSFYVTTTVLFFVSFEVYVLFFRWWVVVDYSGSACGKVYRGGGPHSCPSHECVFNFYVMYIFLFAFSFVFLFFPFKFLVINHFIYFYIFISVFREVHMMFTYYTCDVLWFIFHLLTLYP